MGMRLDDFYHMTIDEFADACRAWDEQRQEDTQWDLFNTRLICYWGGNHKAKRPEELWKLDIDEDLQRSRMKELREWTKAVEEAKKKREQNG